MTTRRDLLSTVASASALAISPARAIEAATFGPDRPAWEIDMGERLAASSHERIKARNRVDRGRDALMRWERRNPFPHGQSVSDRYTWAERYCVAFHRVGMIERREARDRAAEAHAELCRAVASRPVQSRADVRALARLIPYDAGTIIRDAVMVAVQEHWTGA